MYQKLSISAPEQEWMYIPDVAYANYDRLSRTLQLIVPRYAEDACRYPLVVYLPGSAFYEQDMYCNLPGLSFLARRGFVVAALQYRGSGIAKFPAQVQDVHNALTFLRGKASEYHFDPEQIFLMGHSSGGYNSLMAAFTSGLSEFDGGAGHTVKGVIAMSAPAYLNYEPMIPDRGLMEYNPEWFRPELDMLGLSRFEDDPALFQKARVENYVNRSIPPVLLIHGEADGDVTAENSRNLYCALTAAGKQADYWELTGEAHCGPWLWDARTLDLAEEFIRSYL